MKNALAILAMFTFAGCATSTPDHAVKAASSLQVMQDNSSKARTQIDTVLASLEVLMDAPADRLRESYDRYDRDVSQMNEYADHMRENDADLRKNGNTYLAEWQRDTAKVSDPELRALSEDRREEIVRSSQSMRSTVTEAAGSFEAFLLGINDIRKVMGNDLTETGQSDVRRTAVVETARSEGTRVKMLVYRAEQAIEGFRSQITPSS